MLIILNLSDSKKQTFGRGHFVFYHSILLYCVWENICGGKLWRSEWKIAICSKAFAVAVLHIYIADRQGHNSSEKIRSQVKNCKSNHVNSYVQVDTYMIHRALNTFVKVNGKTDFTL